MERSIDDAFYAFRAEEQNRHARQRCRCARASNGQATAVLPSPAMNSRRRMGDLLCRVRKA
jgi:hypothetical protein